MARRRPWRAWLWVAAGLAAIALVAVLFVDRRISEARYRDASEELLLLMTLRRGALESYFDTVRSELVFWSRSPRLRGDLARLLRAWAALPGDPGQRLQRDYIERNPFPTDRRRDLDAVEDGSLYSEAHGAIHPLARAFVSERGYYDFFLIDPQGEIVYTVEKEPDFAGSLARADLRDSGLADVHRRALESAGEPRVVFSDFERYAPSHGAPALFGAVPVLEADGSVLGVLAVQVPSERIHDIMQFTAGMGRSGETYLVGSDLRMRSNSRFSEVPTTLETLVESDTVKRALARETGVAITEDYRGVPVLSAYGPFSLDGVDWAVMAEIDHEEVYESVVDLRLSVPIVGMALYALALISLWLVDPSGWISGDFDVADAGDLPPA